jgi:hypothetical protein
MRDINAILQQAAKKYFAFVETQFEDFHRLIGLPSATVVPLRVIKRAH